MFFNFYGSERRGFKKDIAVYPAIYSYSTGYRDMLELDVCDMLQIMLMSSLDMSLPIGNTFIKGAVLMMTSTTSSLPSSFSLSTRQAIVLEESLSHSFSILDVGLWAGLSPGSRCGSMSVRPRRTASMHQSRPIGSGGSKSAHSR